MGWSKPISQRQASAEHARRMDRLIDRGGAARLKKLYETAQAELERKLAKAIGNGSSPMTIQQHRALLIQLREGQMAIAARLGEALGHVTQDTQRDSLRGLISQVRGVEKHTTGGDITLPIEEAGRFAGVMDKKKTSLLALNKRSMLKYGHVLVRQMEQQLALSLAMQEPAHVSIDRIMAIADNEWWRAERIIRTEQSWTSNATQLDAVKEMASDFPDLFMRWVELVDDETLQPLDNRVGKDSIALHGQLAKPGGMFIFPPGNLDAGKWFQGKSWAHPPNRSNDRAVLQPWRPHWGGYGWTLVGGLKTVLLPTARPPR